MGKFGKVGGKLSKVSEKVTKGLGRAAKASKSISPKSVKGKVKSAAKKVKKSTSKLSKKVKKGTSKLTEKAKNKLKSGKSGESGNEDDDQSEAEQNQEQSNFNEPGEKPAKKKKKKHKHSRSDKSSKAEESGNQTNKVGVKYQIFTVLLTLLIVLSITGFILTAVLHILGKRYLWNTLGGRRILVIFSLTGITSAVSLLLSLAIMIFELGAIKGKQLGGTTAIITMGAIGITFIGTFILFVITVLQHGNVMDIFGDNFLSLIAGYDMDPSLRLTMNRIQIEFECCGHYEPLDWALDEENPELLNVPFSCCSIHALLPCIHDEIPLANYEEDRAGETIYPVGCKYPMETWYKSILIYYVLVAAAMAICQLGLMLLFFIISRKKSSKENDTNE